MLPFERADAAALAARGGAPSRGRRSCLAVLTVGFGITTAAAGQEAFAPPANPPTIRALPTGGPIVVDGRLSESDWEVAPAATGFRQVEPRQGAAATFDTEVRLLYDRDNLYVGARCLDAAGGSGLRVKNLRRDFDVTTDDVFGVSFDTFRDGQNALVFQTNPRGVRRDLQVRDGDVQDLQWDAVWEVHTQVTESGWNAEFAIPWATLRYASARQDWGVNFMRVVRRLNETSGWSPWPRAYPPYRMSYAGILEGLDPPPPARNARVQPYLVAQEQRTARVLPHRAVEAGGDLKWAVTPGTVVDATFNTDFAQADVDQQVVNLTRFSVFFPEQRAFFLENGSLFSAGLERHVRPFFSRRIGLDPFGFPIPIDGGLRLTHRTSRKSAGALLIHQDGTGDFDGTTFAVGRYVQNVARASRVGGLVVSRIDDGRGAAPGRRNTVAALDSFLRVNPNLYIRSMLSGSTTTGGGEGLAASIDVSREGNWGIVWWVEEYVGPRYRADTGYISRPDLLRANPGLNLDLRPAWKPSFVRRFFVSSVANIYHRASDRSFQEAEWSAVLVGPTFQNGGWLYAWIVPTWQRLDQPFAPLPGLRIEPGRYQFTRYRVSTSTDPSRRFSLRIDGEAGPFYDGRSRGASIYAQANPNPHVSLLAAYSVNALRDIGPGAAAAATHLFQPTLRLALDPRLQLTSFYQYNTAAHLATWNARLSWEFRPLSYVYVVYNDRRPVGAVDRATAPPAERQLILKVTFNKPL